MRRRIESSLFSRSRLSASPLNLSALIPLSQSQPLSLSLSVSASLSLFATNVLRDWASRSLLSKHEAMPRDLAGSTAQRSFAVMAYPNPNANPGIPTVSGFHSIAKLQPPRGERAIFFNGRHSLRTHPFYVLSERESESVNRRGAAGLAHCEGAQTTSLLLSNLEKSGSISTVDGTRIHL